MNRSFLISLGLSLTLSGCARTPEPSSTPAPEPVKLASVSALARLEPLGEIHQIGAPVGRSGEPVGRWLVKEGDNVAKGQLLAVMESEPLLKAQLMRAEADVARARAVKSQVEAGPKMGEVRRQEAEIQGVVEDREYGLAGQDVGIQRARTAEETARREWLRYKSLLDDGAVSRSVYDQKELEHELRRREREELERERERTDKTLRAGLESARGQLESLAEVRPTDLRLADAEIASALSEVERVRAELKTTQVLAPIDGTVLEILARTGEVPDKGLAEIGQVGQMVAVAEVHQQDVGRVRLGQSAVVRSAALAQPLKGRVDKLGEQVLRQRIFSNIPGENFDQRVVEVQILLDMTQDPSVRRLSNLQAEAIIEVDSP